MKSKKAVRSALGMSVLSIALCAAMLIGTTFAWFTDTASTAVNKIQAGTLDVALEMEESEGKWVSAEGKTLDFVKSPDAPAGEELLWEPGCTYNLPALRVVNNGNLALKYMIKFTGIKGDAKLNEAIVWTVKNTGDTATGDSSDVVVPATDTQLAQYKLLPEQAAHELTISGHMKESAGNEYQGLSIDGISITVYATQYTYESDSKDNQYDKDSAYKGSQEFTSGTHVLDKGGVALNPGEIAVKASGAGTNVTINGGYYDGGSGGNNQCVHVANGATVTIQGGTFTVGSDANGEGNSVIESNGGNIIIEGGFFQTDYHWRGFYYVLNQQNNNPGTITVKGGTFVNYDPSKGDDNLGGNFVADGYSVVEQTQANGAVWYTVVKGTGVIPGSQEELNDGIESATEKDVTVVMPKNSSFTLDNGIANGKGKDVTFVGDGTQTVDVVSNAITAEGGQLNYQRGSTFTFENLTIQAGTGTYDGIVCDELTYKNCTIKGKLTLYGKATFINCTFDNTMANPNQYSIWTWGGTDVKFDGCTFNTNGKAILLYGEEKTTNLTVDNCTFNDRKAGASGKAAIEVGEAPYGKHNNFTVVINNITVNGHAKGQNTDSAIWANKNSMDAAHLTVTIDGTKVQ